MAYDNESEQAETFNINDPKIAGYTDDDLDPNRNSDEFPPPPPPGKYRLVADFTEEDEEKRWRVSADKKSGKPVLGVMMKFKAIGAFDPDTPERQYMNRTTSQWISSQVFDGRSKSVDILKSTGLIPVSGGSRPTLVQQQEMLTKVVLDQLEIEARLDWEGNGKCEGITDDNNKAVYVRPKEYNSFAKWPKDSESGNPVSQVEYDYRHEATGEEEVVVIKPQMRISAFLPKR